MNQEGRDDDAEAEQVSFLSRAALLRELSIIPHGSDFIIDLRNTVAIDHDVLEILRNFEDSSSSRNIDVEKIPRQIELTEMRDAA